MYCYEAFETAKSLPVIPVIVTSSPVVELDERVTSAQCKKGFAVINLEGCRAPYIEEPERGALLNK